MRGSTLRNTEFVIGIAIYVGTDTKAHHNARSIERKTSYLTSQMHTHFIKMFVVMGLIVCLMSIAGFIIDTNTDKLYLYANEDDMKVADRTFISLIW